MMAEGKNTGPVWGEAKDTVKGKWQPTQWQQDNYY
jgi:hypothetical protein